MGYVIKVTYSEGDNKGKSYILKKGGYVGKLEDCNFFEWEVYKTKGIAERICKKLFEENEQEYRIERANHQRRISEEKNVKDYFIYEKETYEPYEVIRNV